MSDITHKPEEQQPAITAETPKAEEVAPKEVALASEETVNPAKDSPETETKLEDQKKGEEAKEDKSEPKEITHGTLSKTHGGLLSFFKQKRFFYFQDDPIVEEKLKTYLHKESASKQNAAYASQTGKGLWFYSKEESQKDTPHGIIKLAEVTDVVPSAASKFVLKISSGDLHFEAPATERDSWVFTLKGKVAEAKASEDGISESEGYKLALEKLKKPVVLSAAKTPEKVAEKVEEPKETAEEKQETTEKPETSAIVPETAVTSDEEAGPVDMKRSASKKGKRSSSVFAMFGKKDKVEEKKEEQAKEEDSVPEEAKPVEPVADAPPVLSSEPSEVVPTEKLDEDNKPAEEAKSTEEAASPKAAKRHSFFGLFKKEEAEKKEKDDRKDEVLEETTKDTMNPTESTENEATKPVEVAPEPVVIDKSPASASSPPKTKFLSNIFEKKEKTMVPKAEEEAKKEDVVEPEIKVDVPTETEASKDTSVSPEDAVEPATTPKEKRKSSFFSSFKKEKKVDDKKTEEVKSDSEDADAPKPSTSPVPKGLLTGLMRKASRSKSSERKPEVKDVTAPATVTEEPTETPVAATETPDASKPEGASESDKPAPTIGDVVPDAVTVGQGAVKAAA